MNNYIDFNSINKNYGDLKLFENLNLQIEKSKYICIVGPSGCGKTTLLRILAGLEKIDSGSIKINGNNLVDIPVIDRNISFAFQNYALYPHLTVFDNLAFPLKSKARKKIYNSKKSIENEVDKVSKLLEINDLLSRKVNMISGGQQQRVSLGRALITKPDILLLDEPVTHLDAKLRYSTRLELKKIQQLLKISALHVTHDQQEALAVADHIIIMDNGLIIQQDTPINLLNNPKHFLVDTMIGDPPSSILNCSLSKDKSYLSIEDLKIQLTEAEINILNKTEESDFLISITPKNIKIFDKKDENSTKAKIYSYEIIGKQKQLILRIGNDLIKYRSSIELKYKINQEIFISLINKNIRIYNKNNGSFILNKK